MLKMIFRFFFLIGKSPVGESVICFIFWGFLKQIQVIVCYSDLTVTSMLKAAGTRIVKCAMFKTWVKCTVLGSSIHIHRNLFSQFKVLNQDRSKQLVFKIDYIINILRCSVKKSSKPYVAFLQSTVL